MAKVLLIDDSIFTLNHYSEMVSKMGFETITAESGEEGIEKFSYQNPDIVLCDLMMPGMDGFDVLEAIKKIEAVKKLAKIPVFLFVTADIQESTEKKAMESGAQGLIPKPLTEEALRKVLETYGA